MQDEGTFEIYLWLLYDMLILYVYPFQRILGTRACAKLMVAGVDHTDRDVHLRNIAYFSIEH